MFRSLIALFKRKIMNTGNRIKALRKQKAWSQDELAEHAKLSIRTVQRIENNEVEPRGHSLRQIADALGITADEILDWGLKEDRGILLGLNLSSLAFLVVPLLGILFPLIIWVSNKSKVKGVDQLGKKILNCLLTFFIIYLLTAFSYILSIVSVLESGSTFRSISASFLVYGIIATLIYYIWLIIQILINSYRVHTGKEVRYIPAFRFIK